MTYKTFYPRKAAAPLLAILTLLFVTGCPSEVYHRLRWTGGEKGFGTVHQDQGEWTIESSLDDVTWWTRRSGNPDSLCALTHVGEKVDFYTTFVPDTSFWYYSLSMQARRQIPKPGRTYDLEVPRLDFRQVSVRSEIDTIELPLANCLKRRFSYGPQYWSEVQPIPIPPQSKRGFLDLKVLLVNDTTSAVIDSFTISLQYEKHRLVRTIFNPWP